MAQYVRGLFDRLQTVKELAHGQEWRGQRGVYRYKPEEIHDHVGILLLNKHHLSYLFRPEVEEPGLVWTGERANEILYFVQTEVGMDIYCLRK